MEELIQVKIEFNIQFVVSENLYPPDHAIHDHLFCLKGGVVYRGQPRRSVLHTDLSVDSEAVPHSKQRLPLLHTGSGVRCISPRNPGSVRRGYPEKKHSRPGYNGQFLPGSIFKVSVALLSSALTVAMWDFRRFSSLAYLA